MQSTNYLPFPLYHGTSSFFLNSILDNGLGGRNPVDEYRVVDFANALLPIVKPIFEKVDFLAGRHTSFEAMASQSSGGMNFQHGDTYVIGNEEKAVRYALRNRFGSEIFSKTLDIFDALYKVGEAETADSIGRDFPEICSCIDMHCAPILVKINKVNYKKLRLEGGGDAGGFVEELITYFNQPMEPKEFQEEADSFPFRLNQVISVESCEFFLINQKSEIGWGPAKYDLIKLDLNAKRSVLHV